MALSITGRRWPLFLSAAGIATLSAGALAQQLRAFDEPPFR